MTTTNKTPNNTPMTAATMLTPVWGLSSVFPKVSADVTDSVVEGECDSVTVIELVIGGECESEAVTVSVSGGGRRTGNLIKKKIKRFCVQSLKVSESMFGGSFVSWIVGHSVFITFTMLAIFKLFA